MINGISSCNLSRGSRAIICTESSSIPGNTKRVEGPSHFSGARGMPVSLAAWSIASKHLAQSLDPAEPSVKKKRRKKVV